MRAIIANLDTKKPICSWDLFSEQEPDLQERINWDQIIRGLDTRKGVDPVHLLRKESGSTMDLGSVFTIRLKDTHSSNSMSPANSLSLEVRSDEFSIAVSHLSMGSNEGAPATLILPDAVASGPDLNRDIGGDTKLTSTLEKGEATSPVITRWLGELLIIDELLVDLPDGLGVSINEDVVEEGQELEIGIILPGLEPEIVSLTRYSARVGHHDVEIKRTGEIWVGQSSQTPSIEDFDLVITPVDYLEHGRVITDGGRTLCPLSGLLKSHSHETETVEKEQQDGRKTILANEL